jgi:hypothetical protein
MVSYPFEVRIDAPQTLFLIGIEISMVMLCLLPIQKGLGSILILNDIPQILCLSYSIPFQS